MGDLTKKEKGNPAGRTELVQAQRGARVSHSTILPACLPACCRSPSLSPSWLRRADRQREWSALPPPSVSPGYLVLLLSSPSPQVGKENDPSQCS